MTPPPVLPVEVEELLWAERALRAEAWVEPDVEVDVDVDVDAMPVFDPVPVLESAALHRERLVSEWEHAARQVARWQAVQQRILAESLDYALRDGSVGSGADLEVRSMAAELALAVGLSDRTVAGHMADAGMLRDRFPATFDTASRGILGRAQVMVIVDEGRRLDDDQVRARYEELVLGRAEGLTTGRLRVVAKAIAEQLDPTPMRVRHEHARSFRRVDVREETDGMATLTALLPAALAYGVHDRLTQMGRTVRDAEHAAAGPGAVPGGVRSLDQLRADIFSDLLLTGHPTVEAADRDGGDGLGALRGLVQITVPILTLLNDNDNDEGHGGVRQPAMLTGKCPIDPDTARQIAGAASLWDRVLTDPVTGDVRAVDRRFPTEPQRRHLRARDEHCRFPGCRMPVWRTDIDHTIDHADGGDTVAGNLAHLCRRHHTLKHHTAWTVTQPHSGILVWTSPTGRVYTDRPPPTLTFLPNN